MYNITEDDVVEFIKEYGLKDSGDHCDISDGYVWLYKKNNDIVFWISNEFNMFYEYINIDDEAIFRNQWQTLFQTKMGKNILAASLHSRIKQWEN